MRFYLTCMFVGACIAGGVYLENIRDKEPDTQVYNIPVGAVPYKQGNDFIEFRYMEQCFMGYALGSQYGALTTIKCEGV